MATDKIKKLFNDLKVSEVRTIDPENGTENPRYTMLVTTEEIGYLVELLNPDTAYGDITSEVKEYLGDYSGECGLPPGIYQLTIHIDGDGPDICGEYDSWLVFTDIKVYKMKDEDLTDFEKKTVRQY